MNLNRVILIGRMAADPEVRTTNTGQSVVSVRMVTNRTWKDQSGQKQEQAEFHSVTLWGRLADIASQYLRKGGLVMVEGRLQTRSWMNKDNVKQYKTEIVAENLQLGPRSASGESGGYSRPFNTPSTPAKQPTAEVAEEDIPVINENEPISEPIIDSDEVEEKEVDLKDIPF